MRGKPVSENEIEKIISMRKTGHSLPEICKLLKRGSSTVYKYAKDVLISEKYADILKQKQGGRRERARILWNESANKASELLSNIGAREKLFILASLYWGEGTKKQFDIINSDPFLIGVYISCLKELGVRNSDLRLSLRVYDDANIIKVKEYWSKICKVDSEDIISVNVLKGKKEGKLPYGMCRVRVTRGSKYFKIIISMIEFIKLKIIPDQIQ